MGWCANSFSCKTQLIVLRLGLGFDNEKKGDNQGKVLNEFYMIG